MRHEHRLLSHAKTVKLIEDIGAWCKRTGTNYSKLMFAARVTVSTRSAVRLRRRRLTIETADKLRGAMADFPNGITKAQHKANRLASDHERWERQRAKLVRDGEPEIVGDANAECPLCGARRSQGCSHWAKFPSSESPAARIYHAGLLSAGWFLSGDGYRRTGRVIVPGVGVLRVTCDLAPEILDFVPDPLARAEAEFAEKVAEVEAIAHFERSHEV